MIDRGIETKGEIVDEGQDHGQEALEIAEVMAVVEETDIIEEGKTSSMIQFYPQNLFIYSSFCFPCTLIAGLKQPLLFMKCIILSILFLLHLDHPLLQEEERRGTGLFYFMT